MKRLIAAYPTDLEESLEIECKHFAAYLRVKKIDKITAQGICRLLHENNLLELYPNYYIALKMYLCMMVTNCAGERSFSVLRRIKDYLRSTQEEERFNALSLLFIERELTMMLDPDQIIDEFAAAKPRKVFL